MDPLVSFVVPCYKYAHMLPRCVNSILAQTYEDFEITIMDNCSPDNTQEVAGSFKDPRVKYIRNGVNIGHVSNFNKGITCSRGRYVWLVPADDWLGSSDVLRKHVECMERNPGVGYVFCRAIEAHGSTAVGIAPWTDCGQEDRIWNGRRFLTRLIRSNCIAMSSAMVRKECYEELGLFPLDLPYACDWYLWCVFALHYQVAYLPEPMVFIRKHQESLTTAFNREGNGVCVTDELRVLWRVARQAELAGMPCVRAACNASIAWRAARALRSELPRSEVAGLREGDFDAMLRQYARDIPDEEDVRARVYMVLGDEKYWDRDYDDARRSYWRGVGLRPWRLKNWVKCLLLEMGSIGIGIRQFLSPHTGVRRF